MMDEPLQHPGPDAAGEQQGALSGQPRPAEMDRLTRQLLGFTRVLELVQGFAHSPLGQESLASLAPSADLNWLNERQALVDECSRFLDEPGRIRFGHLEDPRPLLQKLRPAGQILEAGEFQALLDILKTGQEMVRAFRSGDWPGLASLAADAGTFEDEISAIERTFEPNGEIRDSAHPQLGQVRRRQSRLRSQLQDHLKGFFSGRRAENLIQDPIVTSRNGRFVIPVRSERQKYFEGVVHGASSSGATLFMEPMTAVPLNNQLIADRDQELEIIRQVLDRLSRQLRGKLGSLDELSRRMGQADALFAIAEFAAKYRCRTPEFDAGRKLSLEEARHPLLLESLGEERTVPISLQLDQGRNGLLISGPNTGGKTVALKTVGLLALMAQAGLPVPVARARFPVFRQVLADIGDRQSIAAHLSTFSAHIQRIRSMMESLEPPSLILIDELGTGTDPVHGAALGIAILEFFQGRQTLVVATTHHQSLKSFAASHAGIENASVELDPKTQAPTYRIRFGLSGDSGGLQMALRLGLPKQIVEQARSRMSENERQAEQYLEQLRGELDKLKVSRQELREQMEGLREEKSRLQEEHRTQLEKQEKEFRKSLEDWSRQFQSDAGRYLKRVQDRFEAARLRQESRRKEALLKEEFRRRFRESSRSSGRSEGPAELLQEGEWVRHRMFQKRGRVISAKPGEVTAEFEGKRMTFPAGQLEKAEGQPQQRKLPRNVSLEAVDEVEPELNLIGATVEEALQRADKYLDRAVVAMQREVLLIHGFGSGKLKGAISDLLKRHPHVSSYKGEGGATRVILRE